MLIPFNTDLARVIGLEEAVLLTHFAYQFPYYKNNKVNYYDGRYWMDVNIDVLVNTLGLWNEEKILDIIDSLVAKGAILIGRFTENPRVIFITITEDFEDCL